MTSVPPPPRAVRRATPSAPKLYACEADRRARFSRLELMLPPGATDRPREGQPLPPGGLDLVLCGGSVVPDLNLTDEELLFVSAAARDVIAGARIPRVTLHPATVRTMMGKEVETLYWVEIRDHVPLLDPGRSRFRMSSRRELEKIESFAVAREAVPPNEDLFRCAEVPIVVASSWLVAAASAAGLSGFSFLPLEGLRWPPPPAPPED